MGNHFSWAINHLQEICFIDIREVYVGDILQSVTVQWQYLAMAQWNVFPNFHTYFIYIFLIVIRRYQETWATKNYVEIDQMIL